MDFIDEYNHTTANVIYFPRSLPCKEVEDLYNHSLEGCNCITECSKDTECSCIKRCGTFYKYSNIYNTRNYSICDDDIKQPTYECNENCSCKERICGNRLVQLGPRKNLLVKSCGNDKGFGLFTSDEIKKGNFICEYAGEVITEAEAFLRYQNSNNKMNYIFCIKETFGEKELRTFIDPTHYGNIGRYINHSCDPNCKLYVIRISNTMPVLGIFADEDIKGNTEITYDYGEGNSKYKNCEKDNIKRCFCNSKNCRRYLPFDMSLATE